MSSLTPPRGTAKDAFVTPKRSNNNYSNNKTTFINSNNSRVIRSSISRVDNTNTKANDKSNSPEALKAATHRVNNSSSSGSGSSPPRRNLALVKSKKHLLLHSRGKSASAASLPGQASVPVATPAPAATIRKEHCHTDSSSASTVQVFIAKANPGRANTIATALLSPVSATGPTPKASGSRFTRSVQKKAPPKQGLSSQTWTPDDSDELLLHQAYDDLFPSMTMTTAMTPKSSHRRTKRNPEIQTVKEAKELLQKQQQQQQRKLQQIQQEHYQKKSANALEVPVPPVPVPAPTTKTPQEQRTFQQQYMEQQAALDRQTSDANATRLRRRSSDDDDDDHHGDPPAQAKLVGAAEAMSTSITFAMNKFHQLLQPGHTNTPERSSSRLVYTATSESFTSSLAAEEKKEGNEDDYRTEGYACTPIYSPRRSSHRRNHPPKGKSRRSPSNNNNDLRTAPSAVSATSSVLSSISSVTGATNAFPPVVPQPFSVLLEEISPMMRMRNPASQQAVEISASSSSHHEVSSPPEETSPSTTFKTEEQVKAEKQRKWKRKMKLAQEEQKQEQAELGDGAIQNNTPVTATTTSESYSYSVDEDDDEEEEEEARTYHTIEDVDDDASDISFGCRPGSNLVELFSTLSGMTVEAPKNFSSNSSKASKNANPSNPVEVLQKVLSARCGVELASSSEDEEEDDGYSYNSDDDSRSRRRRPGKDAKQKNRRRRKEEAEEEPRENGNREARKGRDKKKTERGRSRGRRMPSPPERTRGTSTNSKASMHSETSLGDILGRREEGEENAKSAPRDPPEGSKAYDARADRDRLELHLLQSKPNFRILGRRTQSKSAETTVMSSGSSATPLAGTASANVSLATASVDSGDDIFKTDPPGIAGTESSQAPQPSASSVVSDSPSKGSMKSNPSLRGSVTSLRNVKSVSFDESTISKPASTFSIPTIANLDRSDPNFIKKFVAGLTQHGTPLLWHRSPAVVEPAGSSNASVISAASRVKPESVMAYLRLLSSKSGGLGSDGFGDGTQSPSLGPPSFDSPRLVWCRETISSEGRKVEELGHIELFDIASFATASSMSPSFLKALECFPLFDAISNFGDPTESTTQRCHVLDSSRMVLSVGRGSFVPS
jgi:hypothetical protein